MADQFWVVNVLHDMKKVADDKGYSRLGIAMELATDAYLDDVSDRYGEQIARACREDYHTLRTQVVVTGPIRVTH